MLASLTQLLDRDTDASLLDSLSLCSFCVSLQVLSSYLFYIVAFFSSFSVYQSVAVVALIMGFWNDVSCLPVLFCFLAEEGSDHTTLYSTILFFPSSLDGNIKGLVGTIDQIS